MTALSTAIKAIPFVGLVSAIGLMANSLLNATKNAKILKKKGLVREIKNGVKILAKGEIKVKLNIEGCKISENAKNKIEKAGGKIN